MNGEQRQGPGLGTDETGPYDPPAGREHPIDSLRRPVTRGFALALVALVLVALLWVDHRQGVRMDELEQSVNTSSSSFPSTFSDPETCWLLGALVSADGKVNPLGMTAQGESMTDCQRYAIRGGLGQDLEGNRPR